MQQFLEAKILVPEDYVIISKVEYEELLQADSLGRWMTLKEVLDRINRKYDWFSQKVLKILDIEIESTFQNHLKGLCITQGGQRQVSF